MKLLVTILVTIACLNFRCGAEMEMVEEEISVQRIIRKYIPTYMGPRVIGSRSGDPSGNATSCGPKQANIVATWTPKTIIMGQPVTFDLQMIAPSDLNLGTGTATIYISGESTPFAGFSFDGSCASLKKLTELTCPIKKNDTIKVHYNLPAAATLQIMAGHFTIEVKVLNDKKEDFACVRIDVVIKDVGLGNSRKMPFLSWMN